MSKAYFQATVIHSFIFKENFKRFWIKTGWKKTVINELTEEPVVIMKRIEKERWVLSFCISQLNIKNNEECSEGNRTETLNLRDPDRYAI